MIIAIAALFLMAVIFWIGGTVAAVSEKHVSKVMTRTEGTVVGYYSSGRHDRGFSYGYNTPVRRYEVQLGKTKKENNAHRDTAQNATATSSLIPAKPIISITHNGSTFECVAFSNQVRPDTHSVGTTVTVLYRCKTIPVIGEMFDVRIAEEKRSTPVKVVVFVLKSIALVMLAVSIIVAVIWINNN